MKRIKHTIITYNKTETSVEIKNEKVYFSFRVVIYNIDFVSAKCSQDNSRFVSLKFGFTCLELFREWCG